MVVVDPNVILMTQTLLAIWIAKKIYLALRDVGHCVMRIIQKDIAVSFRFFN